MKITHWIADLITGGELSAQRRRVEFHKAELREFESAAAGQGQWVAGEDMPPFANVHRRIYRTASGQLHRFYGQRIDGPVKWFFPEPDNP
jgi:hypothetical protein